MSNTATAYGYEYANILTGSSPREIVVGEQPKTYPLFGVFTGFDLATRQKVRFDVYIDEEGRYMAVDGKGNHLFAYHREGPFSVGLSIFENFGTEALKLDPPMSFDYIGNIN